MSAALLREAAALMRTDADARWGAVAALLDHHAKGLDEHMPAWTGETWATDHYPVDDPPPASMGDPAAVAGIVEHHYGKAIAVASAYLNDEGLTR